jgi:hypothetical protein
MPETESMPVPPQGELIADGFGLKAWRATFDGVSIGAGFTAVTLRAFRADNEIVFNLTQAQARHLAELLTARADALVAREDSSR